MLILTRRIGEILVIGDDVEINVLAVRGNQVRFGITAPNDVSVHRKEIFDRIQNEKKLNKENNIDHENYFYESRGNK